MPYANPEKQRERNRRYYRENRERILAKSKEWRDAHPEEVKIIQRRYSRKRYQLNSEQEKQRVREYDQANKDKVATRLRDRHLKRRYGLSQEDYDLILAEQNGRCAICGSEDPFDRWGKFHVDHDHLTGYVRGLLCSNCNIGLGQFKDNPMMLKQAIQYLEERGQTWLQ